MEGFFNYEKFLKGKVTCKKPGHITGSLYHLENKGFPGYTQEGLDIIKGEILTIPAEADIIESLDKLEGYHGEHHQANIYNKQALEVKSNDGTHVLDVYVYNLESIGNKNDVRVYIPHGSWKQYMDERNPQK